MISNVQKQELAKSILNYWYTIEFFEQEKFPVFSKNNMVKIKELHRSGKKPPNKFIYENRITFNDHDILFPKLFLLNRIHDEVMACGMKLWGTITVYIGKINRGCCIKAITRNMPDEDVYRFSSPDEDPDKIACACFKISPSGAYIENSFSLSPILWATNIIDSLGENISSAISLEAYNKTIKDIENKFFLSTKNDDFEIDDIDNTSFVNHNQNDSEEFFVDIDAVKNQTLKSLFEYLFDYYLSNIIDSEDDYKEIYYLSFKMYQDEKVRAEDELNDDFSSLCSNFYSEDINMILDSVNNQTLEDTSMGRIIYDYITCHAIPPEDIRNRFDFLYTDTFNNSADRDTYLKKIGNIMDIRNAPLGKWPSRFSSAFMQQAAINIYSDNQGIFNKTIFSVNGPPGTGKTTLLKEIIVNNIIERAYIFSQYSNPDQLFEKQSFNEGNLQYNNYSKYVKNWYSIKDERINDYNILSI